MKTLLITLFTLFIFSASFGQKQVVEDSIPVSGNCEMCKARIESALEIKGIKLAEWNMDSQKLFIAYREDKISEKEIHDAIVATGHDTDKKKAEDEVYAKLPYCCLHRDVDPHSDKKKHKSDH
ncbi:copper chaperone [Fulvivirga sp. RKSG066]|uniref:heavy-metal-associated domain-containing protein n=1 Tax=Fulvivirga aurantia TaxID=2529383 RepID=UPI0012BD6117|nr:heavy-metal-associated domain-containing protein [Fulvivirga aurantia]MTI22766.1 copper chaperone [Fulvivirga aurantia]